MLKKLNNDQSSSNNNISEVKERTKERKKERKNENERKVGWMDGLSVVLLVSYIYIYSAPKFVPPAVLFFVFFLCS